YPQSQHIRRCPMQFEMPKPGPKHKQLEKLAGNWRGEEKMYPSQWDPQGGVALARISSRIALDGFVLIGDYEQERDGSVCFRGHAVHSVDEKTGEAVLTWWDSMGKEADIFRGGWDGDVLTVTQQGGQMHMRMTYDCRNPAQLKSRMEVSTDGKEWKPLFDGVYTKAA